MPLPRSYVIEYVSGKEFVVETEKEDQSVVDMPWAYNTVVVETGNIEGIQMWRMD
jgi:hypothetical protein